MSSRVLTWMILVMMAFFGVKVFAHARILPNGMLSPRLTATGVNDAGIKTGPCGGLARSAVPAVLAPGSTITLNWEETIDHPGRFEIYFSQAGDTGFQLLKTVQDNQGAGVPTPHQFSTTVTLPNVTCTDCTLQLIQVMTENPANPSLYFSCADIRLQSGTTNPSPTPAPAPSPAPQPNCKAHSSPSFH